MATGTTSTHQDIWLQASMLMVGGLDQTESADSSDIGEVKEVKEVQEVR